MHSGLRITTRRVQTMAQDDKQILSVSKRGDTDVALDAHTLDHGPACWPVQEWRD